MGAERRKYTRLATDQIISFAMVDDAQRLAVGRDVSPGGIRFEAVGIELNEGETIRVTFNLEDETVVAIGRVAWATELDAFTTDIGLEFAEIDAESLAKLEGVAEVVPEI